MIIHHALKKQLLTLPQEKQRTGIIISAIQLRR